jgi:5'(3')-deoxyribonucleotidase
MDGVLVDFDKGYEKLTGINIRGTYTNNTTFWDPINRAGYDFWRNLEWMSDGKELWDYIKKYEPELLSAPSRQPESRVAKHDWVKEHLPDVILNLRSAKHKKDFASPNHILIDDRVDNINSWIEAGGIGILHKNTKKTISELNKIGL